ncbi:MAG: cation-transporting P-type ATPase [Clostridia bacterium]|nr:cation-transporting P-type ATPase [Clostridia bacterium]
MKERWYDRNAEELEKLHVTDRQNGLSREEAARRLKEDGRNVVYPRPRPSLRGYLRAMLTDLSSVMLLAAALLGMIYRKDAGMAVILALLFINYGAAVAYYIRSLSIMGDLGVRALPSAKVMRGGKLAVIPSEELVMGDVILLSHGDIVPGDARLIESNGFRVFEGVLFDTDRVTKKDASFLSAGALKPSETPNMVYASTVVTAGTAKAIVVATGEENLVCRMRRNKPIAACHRLSVIRNIRRIGTGAGAALLVPGLVMTAVSLSCGGDVMGTLILCLAFAVAAMPELYAAFSYVVVSFGMRNAIDEGKKSGENAFIKNPLSLPNLCKADLVFVPLHKFRPDHMTRLSAIDDGKQYEEKNGAAGKEKSLRILRFALVSTGVYGAALLTRQNERRENIRTSEEDALIYAGEELKIYDRSLEDRFPMVEHLARGEGGSLFDTTLVKVENEYFVILRGEAGQVLKSCTHYCRDGRVLPLDGDTYAELCQRIRETVRRGLTPVAVATKRSDYSTLLRIGDAQTGLTFEGFVVFHKPLVDNAAFQIARLREAGVGVIAYTPDENEEYDHLSRALGIVHEEKDVVRASETLSESEEIFRANARGKTFFEGFDDAQMRYIVDLFKTDYKKEPGYCAERLEGVYPMCTAVVGFAEEDGSTLGAHGKTKEALRSPLWMSKSAQHARYSCQALNHIADVILPPAGSDGVGVPSKNGRNGGINSIAAAIRCARTVYRNIRLLILYLACTCGMRFAALVASNFTGSFTAPQMLLSGLVFDLMAVFVIASERSGGRFVRRRREKTLAGTVFTEYLPAFGAGALLFLPVYGSCAFFSALGVFDGAHLPTVAFVSTLLTQAALLTAFLRSDRPPFRGYTLSVSCAAYILVTAAFLAGAFLFPGFGELFSLSYPGIKALLAALIVPACLLVVDLVRRLIGAGFHKERVGRK